MKLGELKSHIRTMDGNPKVFINYGEQAKGLIVVQKKSLLEMLDVMFPGGKAVETGLHIDGENRLILTTMLKATPGCSAVAVDSLDDLDDDEIDAL